MNRCLAAVLVWSLSCEVALSAGSPGQGSIGRSVEHEATRLVRTPDLRSANPAVAQEAALPTNWDAVRQLAKGTKVVVATAQDQGIKGRISTVGEDTLQMLNQQSRLQMLPRSDVYEVRRDHRHSVGQHVKLGLLFGSLAGLGIATANNCNCELQFLNFMMTGLALGGVGAVVGLLSGRAVHSHPGKLVYSLPKP